MESSRTNMESHRTSNSSLDDASESFSRDSISLEFDDYPLDLISPVRKDDLEEYPTAWKPVTQQLCHLSAESACGSAANALTESSAVPEEEIPLKSGDISDKEEETDDNQCYNDVAQSNGTFFVNRNTTLPKVQTKPPAKSTLQEAVLYDMLRGLHNNSPDNRHCQTCTSCCVSCCKPCWTKYHPLPSDPTWRQRLKYNLMCPPHGRIGHALGLALVTFLLWTVFYALTGSEALPGGHFFALVMLVVFGYLGGLVMSLIRMPPLIGMLLVGCLMCNVSSIDLAKDLDERWSAALRSGALVVILIRAGLGMDPATLNRLSAVVIRLAFIPSLLEAVFVAISSHYLLGFPWLWGFLLGFGLSAVTPAVVVPGVMWLADRGYDTRCGLPALLTTASSIEDLITLSCFSALLGTVFTSGDLVWAIFRGPLEAVAGIVIGVIFGIICWFIPNKHHKQRTLLRCLMLLGGGLSFVYLSKAVYCPGSGALGCIILSVTASYRWRQEDIKDGRAPIDAVFTQLWVVLEPILFTLVGAEINFKKLESSSIGLGLAIIFVGSIVRMGAALLAVAGSSLGLRQKVFIPFAWLPRDGAVIQAAITSLVLDTAREQGADEVQLHLAFKVVGMAFLIMFTTVPCGGALIEICGRRLLGPDLEDIDSLPTNPESMESFDTKLIQAKVCNGRLIYEVTTEIETVT